MSCDPKAKSYCPYSVPAITQSDLRLSKVDISRVEEERDRIIEKALSMVASNFASEPRRVVFVYKGGPRSGMFSTDLKSTIYAERFPLGIHKTSILSDYLTSLPSDPDERNQFIVMYAGIYHELGHEMETSKEVWRRVIEIARGNEVVDGIPPQIAYRLTDIFNILEDGRMERTVSRNIPGIASFLSASSKVFDRWDMLVGDDVPIKHMLFGLMLYRALPFYDIPPYVFERVPERVRSIFIQILPFIDAAISGDESRVAFENSIQILRIIGKELISQDDKEDEQRILTSSTPDFNELASSEPADIPIPPMPPMSSDEKGINKGNSKIKSNDENNAAGKGEPGEQKNDNERLGSDIKENGKEQGESENNKPPSTFSDESKEGRDRLDENGKTDGFGNSTKNDAILIEDPDKDLITEIRSNDGKIVSDFIPRLISNARSFYKRSHNISNISNISGSVIVDDLGDALNKRLTNKKITFKYSLGKRRKRIKGVLIPPPKNSFMKAQKAQIIDYLTPIDRQAKIAGYRIAAMLESIKMGVSNTRRQISTDGSRLSRRSLPRALAGSRSIYEREVQSYNVPDVGVFLQLDMSASMHKQIFSGQLFLTASTLGYAASASGIDIAVTAFGSRTMLLKTFGDGGTWGMQERAFLAYSDMGDTYAATGLVTGINALLKRNPATKLHFLLTDGKLGDINESSRLVNIARESGIMLVGVYLGDSVDNDVKASLDKVFGKHGWSHARTLEDFQKDVVGKIVEAYKQIQRTIY